MTKWLERYKNTVLIIILVLFMLLSLFYFFMIRPLAAEEKNQQQQLNRIKSDISFYQQNLDKLTPQKFTVEEKSLLIGSIPSRPNVEEVIKDLERTELETGTVIENIAFTLHPNGLNHEENQQNDGISAETQGNEDSQESEQPQASESVQQQGLENILPNETLELVKDKLKDVKNLNVSYAEMVIDVNGEAEDVHKFVNQLESLKRIIHVQSYDYSINEEKNNRLEGIVTIRAFYSEDFAKLMDESDDFKLDYEFDPKKIKRYVDPYEGTSIQPENGDGLNNNLNEEQIEGNDTVNNGTKEVPITENGSPKKETNKSILEEAPAKSNSKFQIYSAPETKYEGEPVFHVVQAGAFTATKQSYLTVKKLMDAGVYPRIIGDEMSYIYIATDSSAASAQKIVNTLKDEGFDSYVKTLPYRLTEEEKEILLTAADGLVGTITEILNYGITQKDYSITDEQLNTVRIKMKAYENKVQQVLKKSVDEERKEELQETLSILSQVENILVKNVTNGELESLWEAEGLILDYMLIFNGYVPSE